MTQPHCSSLDFDAESRRALEFDELRSWVASHARTSLGAAHLLALEPSADGAHVQRRLEALDEMRAHLAEDGTLVPGGLPDPGNSVAALRVEGASLEGKALRDLALLLEAAAAVRSRFGRLSESRFPHLRALGQSVPDLASESRAILRGTDVEGCLLDDASPELRAIREREAAVGRRLRRMLERHLRSPGTEGVIQDDFVTQRNGRFVIPVRTDSPRPVRGIVHARSSSGATQFVEPLESVDLNNERVRLHDEAREEQRRILAAWSGAFRRRIDELQPSLEGLARADALAARCAFGEACGAVTPRVVVGGALRLGELRHPLLQRRLTEEDGRCVPSTIDLDPADRVLVLSGPNTGGKTVALKAVGLAAVMAQSGLPVAAREVELPLYRQVRADVGDHQSIEADLSTFSAHVRAIAAAVSRPEPPALFLFDEIGSGTEPTEGAALARSVLESLVRPGVTAMATTHLGPLKAWAVTSEGASCAAMDFDSETLTPTYRVVMGMAGRSGGLDIAERLGLDPAIVGRARELLDPEVREGEDYLRRLRGALADAEDQREQARLERHELSTERTRLEERRGRETVRLRREADAALAKALDEFRRMARTEIAGLHDPRDRDRAGRRRVRSERRLDAARVRQSASLGGGERQDAAKTGGPVDAGRLVAGQPVWVANLGREGRVLGVHGEEVEVQLGSVTFRVRAADLRLPGESGSPGAVRREPEVRVSAGGGSRSSPRELVLIGQRVEEALETLDRFLDAARMAGHDEVRVVHGHGTGRLRKAVRAFLADHALVRGRRPGREAEGGDGATVVTLG